MKLARATVRRRRADTRTAQDADGEKSHGRPHRIAPCANVYAHRNGFIKNQPEPAKKYCFCSSGLRQSAEWKNASPAAAAASEREHACDGVVEESSRARLRRRAHVSPNTSKRWATWATVGQRGQRLGNVGNGCSCLGNVAQVHFVDLRATGLLDFRLSVAQLPDAPGAGRGYSLVSSRAVVTLKERTTTTHYAQWPANESVHQTRVAAYHQKSSTLPRGLIVTDLSSDSVTSRSAGRARSSVPSRYKSW